RRGARSRLLGRNAGLLRGRLSLSFSRRPGQLLVCHVATPQYRHPGAGERAARSTIAPRSTRGGNTAAGCGSLFLSPRPQIAAAPPLSKGSRKKHTTASALALPTVARFRNTWLRPGNPWRAARRPL